MKALRVERVFGRDARERLAEFYGREWDDTKIRDEDLFFLALEGEAIIGSVRYCVEEGSSMFRSLLIDRAARSRGIGKLLVKACTKYMQEAAVSVAYCIPYAHLEGYYTALGFKRVDGGLVPEFLQLRIREYRASGSNVICMRSTGE